MPRYHHQYLPDKIMTEPNAIAPATASALQAMGYALAPSATNTVENPATNRSWTT